jgi:hypothetical protein
MIVDLNYEQRARLELISIHSGKPAAKVLIDAAQFLLNCEIDYYPPTRPVTQQFVPEEELEARLKRMLDKP